MSIFSQDIAKRLEAYFQSRQFSDLPQQALSDYWGHYHDEIRITLADRKFSVAGSSGYYSPKRRNLSATVKRLLKSEDRKLAAARIARNLLIATGQAELLSALPYDMAFDAVMRHSPVADVDLSPYRIDFRKVGAKPGAFASAAAIKGAYQKTSGGIDANHSVYRAYYMYNILNYFDVFEPVFSFIEIGGGNGTFARLLLERANRTCYMIDLPRTLCGAVEYLPSVLPDLKFLLPNEAANHPHEAADLVFLTPAQTNLIPDASASLVVNVASFQEMTVAQVSDYFDLTDRAIKRAGFLFAYNRVEKIPVGPDIERVWKGDVMRFADYPWRESMQILAEEVCRLGRLTQRDNSMLRLGRVSPDGR